MDISKNLDQKIKMDTKKYETIIIYALHVATRSEKPLNKARLTKAIWWADISYYKDFGITITNDKFIKFPSGPINSKIFDVLKKIEKDERLTTYLGFKNDRHYTVFDYDPNLDIYLNPSEVDYISAAVYWVMSMTNNDLMGFIHQFDAWKETPSKEEIRPRQFSLNNIPIEDQDFDWVKNELSNNY